MPWSGTVSGYVYQWQRSSDGGTTWSSISGATGSTYAPVLEDEGARIRAGEKLWRKRVAER